MEALFCYFLKLEVPLSIIKKRVDSISTSTLAGLYGVNLVNLELCPLSEEFWVHLGSAVQRHLGWDLESRSEAANFFILCWTVSTGHRCYCPSCTSSIPRVLAILAAPQLLADLFPQLFWPWAGCMFHSMMKGTRFLQTAPMLNAGHGGDVRLTRVLVHPREF